VLDDVLATWAVADPRGRRELLGALFDELDVADGRVVGCRPRREHEVEVAALMQRVFEHRTAPRGCGAVDPGSQNTNPAATLRGGPIDLTESGYRAGERRG
jgi:hypothetical protein